jgi:hypothetical protein
MDREQLLVLVRRMLAEAPELDHLIELPIVGAQSAASEVKTDVIVRQVEHAFSGAGDDWRAAAHAARSLRMIVTIGDQYRQTGNSASARTVFEIVAHGILSRYHTLQDEEGDLHGVMSDCLSGLNEILAEETGDESRIHILRFVFDVYLWDVRQGGIGMGEDAPDILVGRSTAAEKATIADWVCDALAQESLEDGSWGRSCLGGFLLTLREGTLDDDEYLDICLRTGRTADRITRLLTRGRVDEAVAAARGVESDYVLMSLGDLFAEQGFVTAAEPLIEERCVRNTDARLTEWLSVQAERRGDPARALRFARETLQRQPSLPNYQRLRTLATGQGVWSDLQQSIIAALGAKGEHHLLTEIYLDEGLVDAALASVVDLRSSRSAWGWGYSGDLPIKVAQAAEATRPRDAIALYRAEAERIITSRFRGGYPAAVGYLARMRDLYVGLGMTGVWDAYITALRQNTKQLRALRADMQEAGL